MKSKLYKYFILRLYYKIYSKFIHTFCVLINKLFPKKVEVFMFHSINKDNDFSVTKENFERFCISIKKKEIISTDNILDKSNSNAVCITFDDVCESVYFVAYPILSKYNIKFTLFPATSYLGKSGYITQNQLMEMSNNSLCTIGSHGVSHSFSRYLTRKLFNKELHDSKNAIESIINKKVNCFAFPYGSKAVCSRCNIIQLYKINIYNIAFSTIPTHISDLTLMNRFFLPRINVTDNYINKYIKNEI